MPLTCNNSYIQLCMAGLVWGCFWRECRHGQFHEVRSQTNTSFAQLPAAGSLLFYLILQDTLQSSQLHPPDNAMLITLSSFSLKYIYKLTNIILCTDLKLYISRHSSWLLLKHLLNSTHNIAWCCSAADCETKSCDL